MLPAPCVCFGTAGENVPWKIDALGRQVADVDRPHLAADRLQICRIVDLLVAQELGPRAVGGVGEVVDRAFALAVPSAGGLRRVLP
jgi:hypothetical protein